MAADLPRYRRKGGEVARDAMTDNTATDTNAVFGIFRRNKNSAAATDALLLHLDAFEGPIDVCWLARDQKVDLSQISICNWHVNIWLFIDRANNSALILQLNIW